MPIYEQVGMRTREDLEQMVKRHHCRVCGARLEVFLSWKEHKTFLACSDWPRTHHEGIQRKPSRYEMEGLASLNIATRREIMVQAFGEAKTMELEKFQGGGQLSKQGAMEVLKLVYPQCPEKEIIRTAMLCADFGLHPLMKEVYLIPFQNKSGGQDWATVIGITANRKIASAKKGAFSFLDDTPRAASQEEVDKQFGPGSQEAKENLISICRLAGEKGNTANGFGLYPKNKNPYGTDKGNTPRNMANIRAERQALDRLPGEAIPLKGIDVIDESYMDQPAAVTVKTENGEVVKSTGELLPAAAEPAEGKPEHWCEEHGCEFQRKVRGSSVWYAHKVGDSWCNEKKKAPGAPATQASVEPSPAPEAIGATIAGIDTTWLAESLKKVKWSEKTAASWLVGRFKVEPGELSEVIHQLTHEQAGEFVKEIQDRLEMA